MIFSNSKNNKLTKLLGRHDASPFERYFSPKDFPEMKQKNFNVMGDNNIELKGAFYFYNEINPDKLIIFDHGISSGHLSYFKEIQYLVKKDYTVYAYDHTGCGSSGGTGINAFSQGINDLDHVLTAIKNDKRFSNSKLFLVGHGWGAYSAMSVVQFHPEVSHVASLAGFISAESIIEQNTSKLFSKHRNKQMDIERKTNPKYADLNAIDSLKNSKAHLIHIQSRDDSENSFEISFKTLYNVFQNRLDTAFLPVEKKYHYPQLTKLGIKERNRFNEFMDKKSATDLKDASLVQNSFDWDKMTEQSEIVWDAVLNFFDF